MASEWLRIAGAVALPNICGNRGYYMKNPEVKEWASRLNWPHWAPRAIFPLTFIPLQSISGYASYLIWKEGGGFNENTMLPLGLYGLGLALNFLYTPITFGYRKLGLASVCMLAYSGVHAVTTYLFWNLDKTAGKMMIPLNFMLAFTTVVAVDIWKNNKKPNHVSED
ncbi:translocator protein-like [Anneissia japonica]|uniref:translocator protein-like n=1 Tax=Anneissia japonica TaxID=1529436 RepID=UPI0014256FFB|nr:translocator protein-like [Anneissia japonica]